MIGCTAPGCTRAALHEGDDDPLCRDHLVAALAPLLADERVALLDAQVAAITPPDEDEWTAWE